MHTITKTRNQKIDAPQVFYDSKFDKNRRKRPQTSANAGIRSSVQSIKKNPSMPRVKKNLDRNSSANIYSMPVADAKSDFTYHVPQIDESTVQTQAYLQN